MIARVTSLRKQPFLLAPRRWERFARRNVRPRLSDRNSIMMLWGYGVPNANLLNFPFLLVDFGKMLCSSANFWRGIYSTNIDCLVVDTSRLHFTFVAFCLLSVLRKQ